MSFYNRTWLYVLAAWVLAAGLVCGSAVAECVSPSGEAGHVIFNTSVKAMQYCNGSDWINAGAVIADAPQTGCTDPAGVPGQIIYAADAGVVRFCNGQSWINTACAATRKPNGPGCGSMPGGTIRYNSTHNELQFCDSTDWVAMGWACPRDLVNPVWNSPATFSYTVMLGEGFNLTPDVTDADSAYVTFSRQGTLPPGMSFDAGTGKVTGAPTTLGTYTFTLRATDTSANYVERTFTVEVVPAEVVVHIAANANNVNLQTLFGSTDWADAAKTKRVIVDPGVTVGSTSAATPSLRTGTGRGKDLVIENKGTIAGAGGAANGGAGGNALLVEQTGVTVLNSGNLYGGGGGGGKGGTGGAGSAAIREPAAGELYSAGKTVWWNSSTMDMSYVVWNGSFAFNGNYGATSFSSGGYIYYRGTYKMTNGENAQAYGVYRTSGGSSTSGGTGGNGGHGQGSDGAATAGLAGAAGGTNAGTGGKGGNGGSWGAAGATGATGTAGNNGAGLAGTAGGAAGRAILGSGYTVTNSGSILGSY